MENLTGDTIFLLAILFFLGIAFTAILTAYLVQKSWNKSNATAKESYEIEIANLRLLLRDCGWLLDNCNRFIKGNLKFTSHKSAKELAELIIKIENFNLENKFTENNLKEKFISTMIAEPEIRSANTEPLIMPTGKEELQGLYKFEEKSY